MEMKSQDSHEMSSSRVGWGQPSSQNSRPLIAMRADASGMDGIQAPVGFFDPLGLSKMASDETLAWYRAAEIKHGRVAMAAFLGCCVTGLGVEFPGPIDLSGTTFKGVGSGGSVFDFWDRTPPAGRLQILA